MKQETIEYLQKIKNGENVFLSKDSPDEISEISNRLKNLGILHKPSRFEYAVEIGKRKHLSKLIELESWPEFMDWLDSNNSNSNITNNFSGSSIGQINQSDNLKVEKTEIQQPIHPITEDKQEDAFLSLIKKFWWKILIPIIIGIVLFVIEGWVIEIW